MKVLLMLIGVLFLSGCENFYSKFYKKDIKNENINCLNVNGKNPVLKNRLVNLFKEENIKIEEDCPYSIDVTSRFLSQCSNPVAHSIGADFDGFLRFDLKKNGKTVYRVQMDWKGELNDERIKDLIKKMKEDLNMEE